MCTGPGAPRLLCSEADRQRVRVQHARPSPSESVRVQHARVCSARRAFRLSRATQDSDGLGRTRTDSARPGMHHGPGPGSNWAGPTRTPRADPSRGAPAQGREGLGGVGGEVSEEPAAVAAVAQGEERAGGGPARGGGVVLLGRYAVVGVGHLPSVRPGGPAASQPVRVRVPGRGRGGPGGVPGGATEQDGLGSTGTRRQESRVGGGGGGQGERE